MKKQIINEIQRKMLPYLNNEQLLHLKAVLEVSFQGVIIEMTLPVLEVSFQGVIIEMGEEQPKAEEQDSAAALLPFSICAFASLLKSATRAAIFSTNSFMILFIFSSLIMIGKNTFFPEINT